MQRVLTVTLLMLLASCVCTAQQPYEFPLSGNQLYPLRWGQQEGSADLVPFPPVLGQPVCARKGSTLQLSIRWKTQPNRIIQWVPVRVVLSSATTGETIWEHIYSGSSWLPADGVYSLPALPDYVEYAHLWSEGMLMVWTGNPFQPVGVMPYSTRGSPSEVFVVLDEPKAPMNPAWVSVLKKSCVWARQTRTAPVAAERLTKELYLNRVYDGIGTFLYNISDAGETFRLKAFIERWGTSVQCNDFADFLVCLVNSIGAYEMKCQRTYSPSTACVDPGSAQGGWRLWTNVVDPAGPMGASRMHVSYHQFACVGNMVWDPVYAFIDSLGLPTYCIGWDRDGYYKSALVYRFLYYEPNNAQPVRIISADAEGAPWNPAPSGGFTPITVAE